MPPDFNLVVFELKLKLLGGAIDKQVSTMHTLVSAALRLSLVSRVIRLAIFFARATLLQY